MSRFWFPRWVWMTLFALLTISALALVFRLGNQASAGVALNDPVVWIEDGSRGRILQINGSTQEITASIDVGDSGDELVALPRGRDAVFLNKTTGELGVIGAISLAIDNSEILEDRSGPLSGSNLELLGDFDASPDAYIIAEDRLLIFEPGAALRADIPTADGLGDRVVGADGRLLAVTSDASRLGVSTDQALVTLLDLPPLIEDGAQAPGLVRSGDSAYLVDAGRRTVREVLGEDELGPTISVCGSLTNVRMGGNVLTSSDGQHRILVHDSAAGILSVSEPAQSDCVQIPLGVTGDNFGDPVAVDDTAYLPNFETGQIIVVDLEERVVVDAFNFRPGTGVAFELEVFDRTVWANEPQGQSAAIVTRGELQRISKRGSFVLNGGGADGGDDVTVAAVDGNNETRFVGNTGDAFSFSDGGGNQGNGEGEEFGVDGAEGGDGGEEPGAQDVDVGAPVPDPANSPIVLQPIEEEFTNILDELIANFVFSADTVNVGEEVRLSDDSSGVPTAWNWDFGDGTGDEGPDVAKVWDTEGIFTVTMLVSNAAGDDARQTHEFTVIAVDVVRVPTADFTFQSDTAEVGEEIVFTDASTGDPDLLLWSFGDETTDSGSQVAHSFAEPGLYEVSLTASNEAGPNTTSALITVVAGVSAPDAIIGPFAGVVEVGQTITLTSESTNSPTAISWAFDDGDSAVGPTVRHSWNAPGRYRIRLSVSNSAGASEDFADIVVEPPVSKPVARFGQSALEIVEGEVISFNDLSLNSPTSLTWEFGDNTTAQGANVRHSWDSPGQFTVTLTARNDAGSDDVAKTVTVIPLPPNPPSASFILASATVPVNSVISFTDSSTGDPTSWQWDFGDGTNSTAQSPPHGYSAPGTYTVMLTASNAGGSTFVTKTVVVVNPPIASFTLVETELTVVFEDTTLGDPTSWEWDFGDGASSTSQSPSHTYDSAGGYDVTLIAANDAGLSAPFSETVVVAKNPAAAFSVITGGLTAQFADESTETPSIWSWDFGDGNTSSSQNPTHDYAASGTYTVLLTVSNGAGSSSASQEVTVALAPPVANFVCQIVGAGVACDGTSSTSSLHFSWSAPGSISSNGTGTANASFTYGASGAYDITLTVTNVGGDMDSLFQSVTVTVPEPPTITSLFVVSNNNGVVSVSAAASNSPTSWSWTAPGASVSGGTTSSPTFTYPVDGMKTVTVFATNAVGDSLSQNLVFSVNVNTPPVVFNVLAVSNGVGSVLLSASATNPPILSWDWSLPGSVQGSSISATPTFTFTSNGTYNGFVTATNADGSSTPIPFSVTISNIVSRPVITAVNQTEVAAGSVALSATATNSPTSWLWSVAGSNELTSTVPSPTFTFATDGSYSGTVTASNAGGTSIQFNFTVNVTGFPPPVAGFTWALTATPNQVQFTSTSTAGAVHSYAFTLGSPSSSTTRNPTVDFAAGPGSYLVTLTVSNANGTSTQFSTTITIP
ncbi:MAG: PKD repeat protein [Verrucomicrobiales bacterium]